MDLIELVFTVDSGLELLCGQISILVRAKAVSSAYAMNDSG
jgi:hypothetical protein